MVISVDPDKERIQLAKESHSQIENLSFVEGSAINSVITLFIGWQTSNKSSTSLTVLRLEEK